MASNKSLAIKVLAACVVALGFAAPQVASASRIYSSFGCFIETDYDGDYRPSKGIQNVGGDIFSGRARAIRCPVIDDMGGASNRTTISQVFIDGFDANNHTDIFFGNNVAKVCRVAFFGTAMTCSSPTPLIPNLTDTTFTGPFDVALDGDDMTVLHGGNALDYAFIQIDIPRTGPLGASEIYGYQTF